MFKKTALFLADGFPKFLEDGVIEILRVEGSLCQYLIQQRKKAVDDGQRYNIPAVIKLLCIFVDLLKGAFYDNDNENCNA